MKPNPIVAEERVARLIPLDSIDPDPDQPRKKFPEAALNELAQRIWDQGLIQPITATAGEDGRFKIFTGERRWRAFQINRDRTVRFFATNPGDIPEDHAVLRYERWTSIPLLEAPALAPTDRILLQVAENHDREDLNLYERAAAICRSYQLSGLKGKDFAVKAGIPPGVLSAYKGLAQSSGLTKLALENGVLQDPKAAVLFQQLPLTLQQSLLDQAQEDESNLTRVQLQRELDAVEAAKAPAQKAAAAGSEQDDRSAASPRTGTAGNDEGARAEPSSAVPQGPFISVDGLLWLQTHLESSGTAGDDEPLRQELAEATRKAVLTSAPFILIRETFSEGRSASPTV